jgi:hypothetical protein
VESAIPKVNDVETASEAVKALSKLNKADDSKRVQMKSSNATTVDDTTYFNERVEGNRKIE